jgi:hypothetical protein
MNKSKKNLFLITLIVLFAGSLILFFPKKEDSGKEIVITMREYVLGSFLNELSELNKKLPNKIDDYTTLNLIKYEDKKIVSIYELASNALGIDVIDKIKPLLKNQACKDEMKRKLLEVDIDLLDRYQNPTGGILFEVSINKMECAQF